MATKVPTQESDMNTLRKMAYPMVIGLALSSYASASFALGSAEQRAACTPDVFRLCASEIPNVDGIIACMKAKKSSLSPACRSVFNPPADQSTSAKTASGK
jgi:hypothetical protein